MTTIIAEKISSQSLYDMMDIFNAQPWAKNYIGELTDLWNLCDHRNEQDLIKDLLIEFCYFTSDMERIAFDSINSVIQKWGLLPETTWIVATANSNEIDGSTSALQRLKNKILPYEKWHSRFMPSIPVAAKKIRENDCIILFDDFIGTGNKIIKKHAWLAKILSENKIRNYSVKIVSTSGMNFGINNITSTGLDAFCANTLLKGISERYPPEQAAALRKIMEDIERKLHETYGSKKLTQFSLGYSQSEAIYCADNDNCPNNVFPIFWWPTLRNGGKRSTLLRRAG